MIARKRPSDTQCCVSFPLALILTLSPLPGALSRPAWRPQHGQEEIWSPEAVIESENFCAVQDYGAACDSLTDDTDSIQDAITACAYSGAVHFPAGQVCISLPLELLSGTTLYLPDNATLRAGSRLMWQVNGRQFNFFDVHHKNDIAVLGGGTVDGNGEQWWGEPGVRPRLFHSIASSRISFQNVTLLNSPAMALVLWGPCSQIWIGGVTILTPAIGETDGIDVGCDGVHIHNTTVINGDDGIVMKGSAQNVLVENCYMGSGVPYFGSPSQHGTGDGIVVGTSNADMRNITYRNCTVEQTLRGISIKFRIAQQGLVTDLVFEDITIIEPKAYGLFLQIDANHALPPSSYPAAVAPLLSRAPTPLLRSNQPGVQSVNVTNITFRHVSVRANIGGVFRCLSTDPCTGIRLEHVHFSGLNHTKASCHWRAAYGTAEDVSPPECVPLAPEQADM